MLSTVLLFVFKARTRHSSPASFCRLFRGQLKRTIEDIMKEKNWREPRRSAESSFSYPTNDDDESGVTVKFGKQVHKVKQSLSRGSNQ